MIIGIRNGMQIQYLGLKSQFSTEGRQRLDARADFKDLIGKGPSTRA